MCGIWGWWNRNGSPAPDEMTIRQAADIMRKRGPDDFGFYRSPSGFAMGFRRLSIIDLTTGHQPVSNEDGSIQVTLNGEIYNFQSVRERLIGLGHVFRTFSDTEVIVHGYEQWGEAVADRLCGMFAIAIWDENHRRLLLIRDRLGIKPLYYFIKNDIFGYASDPRALMTFPDICHSLDNDALSLYLYYGYVPAPWTIYKDIKKLRPGHLCMVSDNSEYISRYWNLSFEPVKQEKELYQQKFSELFGEVVGEHLISDVPLGAFLSGGMDSTSVVQAASEKNGKQILTFNMAFDDPEANESFYARQAADILNSDHHEMSMADDPGNYIVEALSQFPEPFGDSAAVPNYLYRE
ncbi:MAG: asparagine synthase (glutamine-hydrolyzing) [Desulfobacteraceae bacterium]|nr:asparagine synthase (glutamine-hydrolyzing) [Desulfobacteraceae bacterium]